jgi:hypothetical protein
LHCSHSQGWFPLIDAVYVDGLKEVEQVREGQPGLLHIQEEAAETVLPGKPLLHGGEAATQDAAERLHGFRKAIVNDLAACLDEGCLNV